MRDPVLVERMEPSVTVARVKFPGGDEMIIEAVGLHEGKGWDIRIVDFDGKTYQVRWKNPSRYLYDAQKALRWKMLRLTLNGKGENDGD